MKKLIILLFFTSTLLLSAKDINIGDSINLKMSGVSKEQVVEAFKNTDFDIEKISDEKDGSIILTVRGFKVGENSVNIGNKNIVIDIKSVLTPEDKEIYIDLSDKSNKDLYLHKFPYISLISGIIALGAVIFLLKGIKIEKKAKAINPDERFEERMKMLSGDNWAFDVSYAIREYIDSQYRSHFLNGIYEELKEINSEDIAFIQKLDSHKFSLEKGDFLDESRKRAFEIYNKIKGGKKNV